MSLWEGSLRKQNVISSGDIDLDWICGEVLTRSQLRDLIALHKANPALSARSLVLFLILHERDDIDHTVLAKYGITPPPPVSPRDEATTACRDREDLEEEVGKIIHSL